MKLLAILAAGVLLMAGATMSQAAPSASVATHGASMSALHYTLVLPRLGKMAAHRVLVPLDTGTAADATDTPVPTETPAPTSTVSPYPDPVNVFQAAVNKLGLIQTVKFTEVTDGEQPGVDKLHVNVNGSATCAGPAMLGQLTATDTVTGTNQNQKLKYSFVQFNKKFFIKDSQHKNKWAKVAYAKYPLSSFTPTVDAELLCSTATGGGGGGDTGGGCQSADLVNLGPDKLGTADVWKLEMTLVCSDGTGATVDFLVTQSDFLLVQEVYLIKDEQTGITITLTRTRTDFGTKVSIKKPKVGSKKP